MAVHEKKDLFFGLSYFRILQCNKSEASLRRTHVRTLAFAVCFDSAPNSGHVTTARELADYVYWRIIYSKQKADHEALCVVNGRMPNY